MMTLTPERVSKPALPVVTGMTRMILPSRVTVSLSVLMLTKEIIAGPVVKVWVSSAPPHTPLPSGTPLSAAVTAIAAWPGQ